MPPPAVPLGPRLRQRTARASLGDDRLGQRVLALDLSRTGSKRFILLPLLRIFHNDINQRRQFEEMKNSLN